MVRASTTRSRNALSPPTSISRAHIFRFSSCGKEAHGRHPRRPESSHHHCLHCQSVLGQRMPRWPSLGPMACARPRPDRFVSGAADYLSSNSHVAHQESAANVCTGRTVEGDRALELVYSPHTHISDKIFISSPSQASHKPNGRPTIPTDFLNIGNHGRSGPVEILPDPLMLAGGNPATRSHPTSPERSAAL